MNRALAPAGFAVTASPVLRIEPASPSRRFARVPTGAGDPDHTCPHCGFIWEACDCDVPAYQGAFYTEGRH